MSVGFRFYRMADHPFRFFCLHAGGFRVWGVRTRSLHICIVLTIFLPLRPLRTLQAIVKFIEAKYKVGDAGKRAVNAALKKGVASGALTHPKGHAGHYRLAAKAKAEKKPKVAKKKVCIFCDRANPPPWFCVRTLPHASLHKCGICACSAEVRNTMAVLGNPRCLAYLPLSLPCPLSSLQTTTKKATKPKATKPKAAKKVCRTSSLAHFRLFTLRAAYPAFTCGSSYLVSVALFSHPLRGACRLALQILYCTCLLSLPFSPHRLTSFCVHTHTPITDHGQEEPQEGDQEDGRQEEPEEGYQEGRQDRRINNKREIRSLYITSGLSSRVLYIAIPCIFQSTKAEPISSFAATHARGVACCVCE